MTTPKVTEDVIAAWERFQRFQATQDELERLQGEQDERWRKDEEVWPSPDDAAGSNVMMAIFLRRMATVHLRDLAEQGAGAGTVNARSHHVKAFVDDVIRRINAG